MSGNSPLKDSEIVQICYVVPDLESACQAMRDALGIGPFVGGSEFALEHHHYRGAPADPIRARGVFVQSGDLNIELIELLSDGPSAFAEMFPDKGMHGIHHVAMFSDDYEATRDRLVAAGYPVVSEFTIDALGATICYVDTRPLLGHMLELYPENAGIRAMYAQARTIAGDWSAGQLIVPWG